MEDNGLDEKGVIDTENSPYPEVRAAVSNTDDPDTLCVVPL